MRLRLVVFALLSALCAGYVWHGLEVRTEITEFLPRDARAARLTLARELTASSQSRAVILTLGGGERAQRLTAARALSAKLEASGHFSWVRAGLDQGDQSQFYALFFPARLGLLTPPDGEGPIPDAWLEERVQALRQRLSSPLGMVEQRLAPQDPLGAFQGVLSRFGQERGALTLEDNQLVTRDGAFAVLFAETKAQAFDTPAQRQVADTIAAAFAEQRRVAPALTLEWSGVNRFALSGEASVKGDIERISTLSLFGIFLLYLLVFRSLREPLVVLLPISFGCLIAVAVCQLAFGFVHGLSLAFGSSIIGVAEDFSTHYFAHRRAAPAEEGNEALMVRLWPGMWLGALTTIVGILALCFSGFPGLVQMSIFGSVGVLGALVCTRYVLPSLSRARPLPPTRRLAPLGLGIVRALSQHPVRALWLVVPCLLLSLGALRLHVSDGMRALKTPTPELDAENARIQARLGRAAQGRAVIAVGKTDETALRHAELAVVRLSQAREDGLVSEFRGITDLVPSVETQRARRTRITSDASFRPRLTKILAEAGMRPEAFQPFFDELTDKAPQLTPERVASSPLGDLIRPFRVKLDSGVAYLLPVTTSKSKELDARFHDLDGIYYLDQEALFDEAYTHFRTRALRLLGVGFLLVFGTLLLRYRSLRVALLGLVPAVLGAGATLGVEGLLGMPFTLMHVIGVLLVVSMGVDYGIYVLESRDSLEEGVTTLGSIVLAALTTVLSFGLLGLSDNPALSGIGVTVSLGLLFSVAVSPVVIALSRATTKP